MPAQRCQSKGRPGYKWGEHGKCYCYTSGNERSRKAAYDNAALQGRAIEWRRHRGGIMKTATIKRIFGTHLQGSMGLALTLLERASLVNWETLWPQFQNALIGLGAGAIAYINRQAIAKGLTDLAQRIAAFQPVASPMPGEALTWVEMMPMPYVPLPSIEWIREHPLISDEIELELKNASNALSDAISNAQANPPPGQSDKCRLLDRLTFKLGELGDKITDAMPSVTEWRQHMVSWAPDGWSFAWDAYSRWIDELRKEWGCEIPTPIFPKEEVPPFLQ